MIKLIEILDIKNLISSDKMIKVYDHDGQMGYNKQFNVKVFDI